MESESSGKETKTDEKPANDSESIIEAAKAKREEVKDAFGDFGKTVSSRLGSWWAEK